MDITFMDITPRRTQTLAGQTGRAGANLRASPATAFPARPLTTGPQPPPWRYRLVQERHPSHPHRPPLHRPPNLEPPTQAGHRPRRRRRRALPSREGLLGASSCGPGSSCSPRWPAARSPCCPVGQLGKAPLRPRCRGRRRGQHKFGFHRVEAPDGCRPDAALSLCWISTCGTGPSRRSHGACPGRVAR